MTLEKKSRLKFALKIAAIHFTINILIAVLVTVLVLYVWYPYPYNELMGGLHLLALIIAVDIVCGPVLTMILANPKKPKRELMQDFSLVAIVQFIALVYGLYAVFIARPVYVVFEKDRFVVVSAAEINTSLLAQAPKNLQKLPLFGIQRIGIRDTLNEEMVDSTLLSLQGIPPSIRPSWWVEETDKQRKQIQQTMRPLKKLEKRYSGNPILNEAIKTSELTPDQLYYLPFTSSKNKDWTVLLDKDATFKSFMPLDSFE